MKVNATKNNGVFAPPALVENTEVRYMAEDDIIVAKLIDDTGYSKVVGSVTITNPRNPTQTKTFSAELLPNVSCVVSETQTMLEDENEDIVSNTTPEYFASSKGYDSKSNILIHKDFMSSFPSDRKTVFSLNSDYFVVSIDDLFQYGSYIGYIDSTTYSTLLFGYYNVPDELTPIEITYDGYYVAYKFHSSTYSAYSYTFIGDGSVSAMVDVLMSINYGYYNSYIYFNQTIYGIQLHGGSFLKIVSNGANAVEAMRRFSCYQPSVVIRNGSSRAVQNIISAPSVDYIQSTVSLNASDTMMYIVEILTLLKSMKTKYGNLSMNINGRFFSSPDYQLVQYATSSNTSDLITDIDSIKEIVDSGVIDEYILTNNNSQYHGINVENLIFLALCNQQTFTLAKTRVTLRFSQSPYAIDIIYTTNTANIYLNAVDYVMPNDTLNGIKFILTVAKKCGLDYNDINTTGIVYGQSALVGAQQLNPESIDMYVYPYQSKILAELYTSGFITRKLEKIKSSSGWTRFNKNGACFMGDSMDLGSNYYYQESILVDFMPIIKNWSFTNIYLNTDALSEYDVLQTKYIVFGSYSYPYVLKAGMYDIDTYYSKLARSKRILDILGIQGNILLTGTPKKSFVLSNNYIAVGASTYDTEYVIFDGKEVVPDLLIYGMFTALFENGTDEPYSAPMEQYYDSLLLNKESKYNIKDALIANNRTGSFTDYGRKGTPFAKAIYESFQYQGKLGSGIIDSSISNLYLRGKDYKVTNQKMLDVFDDFKTIYNSYHTAISNIEFKYFKMHYNGSNNIPSLYKMENFTEDEVEFIVEKTFKDIFACAYDGNSISYYLRFNLQTYIPDGLGGYIYTRTPEMTTNTQTLSCQITEGVDPYPNGWWNKYFFAVDISSQSISFRVSDYAIYDSLNIATDYSHTTPSIAPVPPPSTDETQLNLDNFVKNPDGTIDFNFGFVDSSDQPVTPPAHVEYINTNDTGTVIPINSGTEAGATLPNSSDERDYVITKSGANTIKVAPKNKNLQSITFGVSGTIFTINLSDIENQTEPLAFKGLIKDDTSLRSTYSFAQEISYGIPKVYEVYTSTETITNASGIKYTRLNGYEKWIQSDSKYSYLSMGIKELQQKSARIMDTGVSGEVFYSPKGATKFSSTNMISTARLSFSSAVMFVMLGEFDGLVTVKSSKATVHGELLGDFREAIVGATVQSEINTKVAQYITDNGMVTKTGAPARLIELEPSAKKKTINARLNNGVAIILTFSDAGILTIKSTNYTRCVRIDGDTFVEATSNKFCVGDNGAIAYGSGSKDLATSFGTSSKYYDGRYGGTYKKILPTNTPVANFGEEHISVLGAPTGSYTVGGWIGGGNAQTVTSGDYTHRLPFATTTFTKLMNITNGVLQNDLADFISTGSPTTIPQVVASLKVPVSQEILSSLTASKTDSPTSKTRIVHLEPHSLYGVCDYGISTISTTIEKEVM